MHDDWTTRAAHRIVENTLALPWVEVGRPAWQYRRDLSKKEAAAIIREEWGKVSIDYLRKLQRAEAERDAWKSAAEAFVDVGEEGQLHDTYLAHLERLQQKEGSDD
jgi:hypothetical protein